MSFGALLGGIAQGAMAAKAVQDRAKEAKPAKSSRDQKKLPAMGADADALENNPQGYADGGLVEVFVPPAFGTTHDGLSGFGWQRRNWKK